MKALPIFACLILVFFNSCSTTPKTSLPTAQTALINSPSDNTKIKNDTRIMLNAYAADDYDKAVKYWHPIIVGIMSAYGGIENILMTCAADMKKKTPLQVDSYSRGGPIVIYQTKMNKYAVIPAKLVFSDSKIHVASKDYYIGHYVPNLGWRYVPRAMISAFGLRTFFPDFPKGAEPPESITTVYDRKTNKVLFTKIGSKTIKGG